MRGHHVLLVIMSVKIGTTIAGTYQDGPGHINQSHLIYAANAGIWWLFTTNSVADVAGNPGTHTLDAYYSSSSDLMTATWTKATSSPNLNAASSGVSTVFNGGIGGGRSMGCCYVNNASGSNKDLVYIYASLFYVGGSQNSFNGLIRAVVTANTITWGNWGGWSTSAWNLVGGSTAINSNNVVGITTDGKLQLAACVMHSELDASVCTTVDNAVSDAYDEGCITATGDVLNASALIKTLSNELRLKVGMALSNESTDWATGPGRFPKINTIDSGTQVTVSSTATGTANTTGVRWWQGTPGTTRVNTVMDSSMTHECGTHAFAQLEAGGMLVIYGDGANTNGSSNEMKSIKANQTQAQGFWPSTTDGTGSKAVFGASVATDPQDWCIVSVDTTHIYAARRTGNTTIATRAYNTAGNSWSATANQPPALTGKVIKAGAGVVGISDGTNFWLFIIDSTDNAIKYCNYTVAAGTWGAWTTLEAVDSTATKMGGYPSLGSGGAAVIYSVTNGGNFDTYVSALPLSVKPHGPFPTYRPDLL